MDWIGCGSEYTWSSWIGLDWVSQLVDWVGLDLAKWTHVQLWAVLQHFLTHNDDIKHEGANLGLPPSSQILYKKIA